MMILAFAAALLAADTPAAAEAAKAPAAATKPAVADKNAQVCKREAALGTRMKTRVCMTQAEWDQRKQDARNDVDAAQRNRSLSSN